MRFITKFHLWFFLSNSCLSVELRNWEEMTKLHGIFLLLTRHWFFVPAKNSGWFFMTDTNFSWSKSWVVNVVGCVQEKCHQEKSSQAENFLEVECFPDCIKEHEKIGRGNFLFCHFCFGKSETSWLTKKKKLWNFKSFRGKEFRRHQSNPSGSSVSLP